MGNHKQDEHEAQVHFGFGYSSEGTHCHHYRAAFSTLQITYNIATATDKIATYNRHDVAATEHIELHYELREDTY